jgi:ribosome maturation factor RimP
MAASSQVDGVLALAEPVARQAGLTIEDITVTRAGRRSVLRIVVDLPEDETGAVSLDTIAEVSRGVSQALDAGAVMGGAPYVLEVSSPGVDRPLTQPRHWKRARGRLVTAILRDGGTVTGRLERVDAHAVLLGDREVAWNTIVRGRMEVDFSRAPDGEDNGIDGEEIAVEGDLSQDGEI